MNEKKEGLSVENSIQTRLSSVMLLVLVFALGINIFIFSQIQNAVSRIDAVFGAGIVCSKNIPRAHRLWKIIIVMNRITVLLLKN